MEGNSFITLCSLITPHIREVGLSVQHQFTMSSQGTVKIKLINIKKRFKIGNPLEDCFFPVFGEIDILMQHNK